MFNFLKCKCKPKIIDFGIYGKWDIETLKAQSTINYVPGFSVLGLMDQGFYCAGKARDPFLYHEIYALVRFPEGIMSQYKEGRAEIKAIESTKLTKLTLKKINELNEELKQTKQRVIDDWHILIKTVCPDLEEYSQCKP